MRCVNTIYSGVLKYSNRGTGSLLICWFAQPVVGDSKIHSTGGWANHRIGVVGTTFFFGVL
jgi:hypothetical protein